MKLMDKLELIDIIRNEAISLGLNPDNYTAALYSTAGEESSFDPTARQVLSSTASQEAKNLRVSQSDDEFLSSTIRGKGFGLFQLDGISKNGFYNWTKENNLNPNSPEAQVRFLLLDSTGNLDTKYNGGSFLGTTNAKNLASTMENITPEKAAIEFRGKYIKPQVFDAAEQQQQLSHLLDLKKVIDNLEYTGEVVVNPDNNPDNNLPDVDPTNELTPEATDTSNVTDEKTIRDTGLTIKDTEKPSGKYPFIPDFLENLFSPSEENPEPIIPQSVQEAENFDAVRKMHSEKNFNEGGAVPMKEQMSMFEDGGLMDEGNTIDPISGNDVPPGSTQEEVRDDIPAQLSEGEFVFPADVVRYIGLEKLMQMRQQAKMGLQTMDDMGQMGNSDEAIMSDTIPFELSDLDIQDETEYNNDTVEMATGGLTGPATGIAGFVPSQVPATSFVQQPQAPVTVPAPQQATTVAPKQQQTPTFTPEDMKDVSYSNLFSNSESAPQTLDIINPTTGERRTITFIPGVTPIPEGFIKASESTAPAQETSVTPTVGQAQVREETRDDARRDATERAKFEEATARKKIIAEMFGENYLEGRAAEPFSDLFGKQEPGTVTTGGYIVGDNGELLNPETGEQEFFGRDGYMIPLGVKDKPKLDTSKEGGVNRRLQRAVMLQKGEERRSKISPEQRRRDKQKADEAFKSSIQSDALKEMRNVNTKPISDLPPSERAREQEKRESQRERLKASQERATQRAKSTVDPDGAYGAGIAKGGLLSKKKVKLKKMRSGGLASKK